MMMNTKTAISTVQREIKKILGVEKIPHQASSENIRKELPQSGDITRLDCMKVVSKIKDMIESESLSIESIHDSESGVVTSHPDLDNQESSITFSNKFEKAGEIEKIFTDNSITASDAEIIELSENTSNSFDDYNSFVIASLEAWKSHKIQQSANQLDAVSDLLADIKASEVTSTNKMHQSLNATKEFLDDLQSRKKAEFAKFIGSMMEN
jgi:hypothetical protein